MVLLLVKFIFPYNENLDLETANSMLKKQGDLFHKINLWRVKTMDAAFEAAINAATWEVARSFGLENLDGIR